MAGASDVYSKANDLFQHFLRIPVSLASVFRVSNALGAQLESVLTEPAPEPVEVPASEVVYASMDGSMVQTDDGYKEVKAGRVWAQSSITANGSTRNRITESRYSAHLGHYSDFLPKFEASLSHLWIANPRQTEESNLVFITDGANWIHAYTTTHYPAATHILDYFHAVERLHTFSTTIGLPATWFDEQCKVLKEQGVSNVIHAVEKQTCTNANSLTAQNNLLTYYRNNAARMDYPAYLKRGLCIGNGAMEAANRTLVQTRCKRSGQIWSEKGVNHILNLRSVLQSNNWEQVVRLLS